MLITCYLDWAGGLAWLGRGSHTAKVKGSSPFPPIFSSVQPTNHYSMMNINREKGNKDDNHKENKDLGLNNNYRDRDIYNREERFRYWLARAAEDKINGNEIIRFITYMQEQNLSLMWMTRTITILLHVSRMLGKPFKDATKDDIKKVIAWVEGNDYSASSIRKYKQVIKYFYKVLYGNNEYYPMQVAWITGKVSKDLRRKEEELSFNNYLTETVHAYLASFLHYQFIVTVRTSIGNITIISIIVINTTAIIIVTVITAATTIV